MVDFLILGGGTSGAYLAARILDQDTEDTVILVEQGLADFEDANIRAANKVGSVMFNPAYIRSIKTPDSEDVGFGTVLGGGSSVNGGYMVFPSNEYLSCLSDTEDWISIRDELKVDIPSEQKKAGTFMRTLNTHLQQHLIDDTFYTWQGERVSSVSFLEKHRDNPRLTILAQHTVHSIKKMDDTFYVGMTDGSHITSKTVVLCCGAATPEILARSIPEFVPSPVFNHTGVRLRLNKDIGVSNGQIFFPGTEGYTAQILVYGKDVNIYNLFSDQGWDMKLSPRGEMYYTGNQMSDYRKIQFDVQIAQLKRAVEDMGYTIVEEGPSPAYHMVGGTSHIVEDFEVSDIPGLYIADLSILPKIPDANTSFMAFMIAEKFLRDVLL